MEKDASVSTVEADDVTVELKDPVVAAFLAWLIPGAGHLYQGRIGKGLLFMTCILGTFFYRTFFGYQLQPGSATMGAAVATMMLIIILAGVLLYLFGVQRRLQRHAL